MVEIENKYKIYEKKFGYINWLGFFALYKKEILRFLNVAIQTIFSPLVTSLLFLMVLSLAIGNDREGALGVFFYYISCPGLIAMQIIQQAFFSYIIFNNDWKNTRKYSGYSLCAIISIGGKH